MRSGSVYLTPNPSPEERGELPPRGGGRLRDLNKDIGSLVKKGHLDRIQKALSVVRVIGNESVHPGQIDLNDNPATTSKLFELVNIIADKMITEPKEIDKLFEVLKSNIQKNLVLK